MTSKEQRAGYLLIDNRFAPPELGIVPFLETATHTCSHCHRQIPKKPEIGYCCKCDAYLCDRCAVEATVTGECRPIAKVFDELLTAETRGTPLPLIGANHGQVLV